jgi:hypothetical protein
LVIEKKGDVSTKKDATGPLALSKLFHFPKNIIFIIGAPGL